MENVLTAYDRKMEGKINHLIDEKIEEDIFYHEEKEYRKNDIIMVNLNKSNKRENEVRKKMTCKS